jgi:endonuclease/exonuclease/phosphatase family metal-dependent hydrolase
MNQSKRELKGIWWNVWHDARDDPRGAHKIAQKILNMIKEHNLDWICLQEAYRYDKWGKDGDVVRMVQKATGWKGVFAAGNTYHYDNSQVSPGNNYTEGVLTISKWPIAQHQTVSLGPSIFGERIGMGGERTLLETQLDTPNGRVTVGNAHWTRIRHDHRKYRKGEMKAFRAHIESLPEGASYIVGGDFNTLPLHPVIRRLGKSLDLRTGPKRHTTWVHKGKHGRLIRCNLDYVGSLLTGPLEFINLMLLDRNPSDHAPLLASFRLDEQLNT